MLFLFASSQEQYKFIFKMLWDYMNTHMGENVVVPNDEIDEPNMATLNTLKRNQQAGL